MGEIDIGQDFGIINLYMKFNVHFGNVNQLIVRLRLKKVQMVQSVLQGMSATAGTIPAMLVMTWVDSSAGNCCASQ